MKYSLLLIIAISLFSCQNQTQFEKNLVDESQNTFWVRKAKDSSGNFNYFGIQIIFNKDKTSQGLYSDNENSKGKYDKVAPNLSKEKKSNDWDFREKDSLFFMYPNMYKVNRYSKDTIFINAVSGKKAHYILVRKRIK